MTELVTAPGYARRKGDRSCVRLRTVAAERIARRPFSTNTPSHIGAAEPFANSVGGHAGTRELAEMVCDFIQQISHD